MTTATMTIEQIQAHALQNTRTGEVLVIPEDFPINQYVPQGDVNILRIATIPEGAVPIPKNRQLAPGFSQGSNHCIKESDMEHCDFYGFLDANPLEGPIIVFNAPTTIEHPKHDHHLWPVSIVMMGYQRRHADEVKRTQD